jgi:hypothetical protein
MAGGFSSTLGKLAHPDGSGGHTIPSQQSIIEQHKAEVGGIAFYFD